MKLNERKIQECAAWVRENGLMECGGASLMSFCAAMGIDQRTYYRWQNNASFADAIKEAQSFFKSNLKEELVMSLAKLAKGYKDVKITEYGKPSKDGKGIETQKIQRTTVTTPPNTGAAIFLLTNFYPDEFKNQMRTEVTGKDGTDLIPRTLNLKEQLEAYKKLDQEL